jgi:hypothetical protein
MRKEISSRLDVGLAVAALAVAVALTLTHQRQSRAKPEDSVARLFGALASKDTGAVRTELLPVPYEEFLLTLGSQKFERVQGAYDRAYQLGDARWVAFRERARSLAADDYDRLRLRVATLGRDAFEALAVDARMTLMDDQDLYQRFLFEKGVSALPPTDRSRIGNASEFRSGQDRDRFLDREGFAALPAAERAIAGNASALADEDTDEKLALHDKFGLPLLSSDLRDEIGSISRADIRDAKAFKLTYGEALAKTFLQEHRIPAEPGHPSCSYPWAAERGSLIKGDEAVCNLSLPLAGGVQAVSISLIKQGFEWRVARISPALTEIGW